MLSWLLEFAGHPAVERVRHHPWRPMPIRVASVGGERVVTLGAGPGLRLLARGLGGTGANETVEGGRLGTAAAHLRAELDKGAVILARLPRAAVTAEIERTALVLPELVDAVLPASRRGARPPGKSARETERCIRRNQLVWRWRDDAAAFGRFHDGFYRSYVERQYGADAVLRPRWRLRLDFRRGGIIEICSGTTTLAMELCRVSRSRLHVVAAAAAGPEARRLGALGACTLAELDIATERKLSEIQLGGSLPSLTDPVLRNKQDWGAELRLRPQADHLLMVAWNRPSATAKAMIERLQPIVHLGDRLLAIGATGVAPPADFRLAGLAGWWAASAADLASSAALVERLRRQSSAC